MLKMLPKLLIPSAIILLIGGGIAFTMDSYQTDQVSYLFAFIDSAGLVALFVFILGSGMLITEKGLFNAYVYSIKHFRAKMSKNYRSNLMLEYDIDDPEEITDYLQENYLYKKRKFQWTKPFFFSGLLVFIVLVTIGYNLY